MQSSVNNTNTNTNNNVILEYIYKAREKVFRTVSKDVFSIPPILSLSISKIEAGREKEGK